MQLTSIIAIYVLFWVMSAFLMLPFGLQTADEAGVAKVPGQADSAPVNFRPGRVALRATVLSLVLCSLFIANFQKGWITAQDINIFGNPPTIEESRQQAAENQIGN